MFGDMVNTLRDETFDPTHIIASAFTMSRARQAAPNAALDIVKAYADS